MVEAGLLNVSLCDNGTAGHPYVAVYQQDDNGQFTCLAQHLAYYGPW